MGMQVGGPDSDPIPVGRPCCRADCPLLRKGGNEPHVASVEGGGIETGRLCTLVLEEEACSIRRYLADVLDVGVVEKASSSRPIGADLVEAGLRKSCSGSARSLNRHGHGDAYEDPQCHSHTPTLTPSR